MTIPVLMLVGFAAWTVLLLLATVGVYRWSRILTGRVPIGGFRADRVEGADWYLRAMRAHANCVENLPVFGAIVLGLYAGNVAGALVNGASSRRAGRPHHAIAGARIFGSDQPGGIGALRLLCRADRQLSVVDRDPADQAERQRITTAADRDG